MTSRSEHSVRDVSHLERMRTVNVQKRATGYYIMRPRSGTVEEIDSAWTGSYGPRALRACMVQ